MIRSNRCLLVAAAAVQLFACSDEAATAPAALAGSGGSPASAVAGAGGSVNAAAGGSAGTAGQTSAAAGSSGAAGAGGLPPVPEPPPPNAIPEHHLGRPFTIVDGVIRADSNEYGLQASLYAIRSSVGATLEVTRDTGEICLRGEVARVAEGPFGGNFAGFGFITGEHVSIVLPGLQQTVNLDTNPSLAATYGAATGIVIDPNGPVPWGLGDGRVLGIAATVYGPLIPQGPGGQATPGGVDPDASEANLYGNCDVPGAPAGSQERRADLLFPALHYYCWNTATLPYSGWNATSTIVFGWGVPSVRVPGVAPEDPIEIPPDAYDFCFRDLRPIVIGAGPDEPLGDVDAGTPADAGDAGL